MKTARLYLDVEYDENKTDPDALARAADILLETSLSTPGIMEEYGNPSFGFFFIEDEYREYT